MSSQYKTDGGRTVVKTNAARLKVIAKKQYIERVFCKSLSKTLFQF